MANALDQARALIETRIKELDEERKRLERALSDLSGTRRGPGRPRGSTSTGSGNGRRRSGSAPKRRRRRRGGTRAEQALKYLQENPGMTAAEISGKLGIKPNYVYRVMAELETDGKVKKQGKGYHPVSA